MRKAKLDAVWQLSGFKNSTIYDFKVRDGKVYMIKKYHVNDVEDIHYAVIFDGKDAIELSKSKKSFSLESNLAILESGKVVVNLGKRLYIFDEKKEIASSKINEGSVIAASKDGTILSFHSSFRNSIVKAFDENLNLKWEYVWENEGGKTFAICEDAIYHTKKFRGILKISLQGKVLKETEVKGCRSIENLLCSKSRVYALCNDYKNHKIVALDRDLNFLWEIEENFYGAVVGIDETLYFKRDSHSRYRKYLVAISKSGNLKWAMEKEGYFAGNLVVGGDGTLYTGFVIGENKYIIAIDESGEIVWKIEINEEPELLALETGALYILAGENKIYKIELSDKTKPVWACYGGTNLNSNSPQKHVGDIPLDGKVTVEFFIEPSDAEVEVDGKKISHGNKLELSKDEHEISIQREGYMPVKEKLYIYKDNQKVRYTLTYLTEGQITTVDGKPASDVTIDFEGFPPSKSDNDGRWQKRLYGKVKAQISLPDFIVDGEREFTVEGKCFIKSKLKYPTFHSERIHNVFSSGKITYVVSEDNGKEVLSALDGETFKKLWYLEFDGSVSFYASKDKGVFFVKRVYTAVPWKPMGYEGVGSTVGFIDSDGNLKWQRDFPFLIRKGKTHSDGTLYALASSFYNNKSYSRIVAISPEGNLKYSSHICDIDETKEKPSDILISPQGEIVVVFSEYAKDLGKWMNRNIAVYSKDLSQKKVYQALKKNEIKELYISESGEYYIIYEKGRKTLIRASKITKDKLKKLWEVEFEEFMLNVFAGKDTLYVAESKKLVAIKDGKILWQRDFDHNIESLFLHGDDIQVALGGYKKVGYATLSKDGKVKDIAVEDTQGATVKLFITENGSLVAKVGETTLALLKAPHSQEKKVITYKGKSKVKFDTYPQKATVYIDGKKVGETPFEIEIEKGWHEFLIKKDGYNEIKEKVLIDLESQQEKYTLTFNAKGKVLDIDGNPVKGAEILFKVAEMPFFATYIKGVFTKEDGTWQKDNILPGVEISPSYGGIIYPTKKLEVGSFVESRVIWKRVAEFNISGYVEEAKDGVIIVSDGNYIRVYSREGEILWERGEEDLSRVRFLNDRIYIISKGGRKITALLKDGKELWQKEYDKATISQIFQDENKIYILKLLKENEDDFYGEGYIEALKANGETLWQVKLRDSTDYIALLKEYEDMLYIKCSGIYGVSKSGKILFEIQDEGEASANSFGDLAVYYDGKVSIYSKDGKLKNVVDTGDVGALLLDSSTLYISRREEFLSYSIDGNLNWKLDGVSLSDISIYGNEIILDDAILTKNGNVKYHFPEFEDCSLFSVQSVENHPYFYLINCKFGSALLEAIVSKQTGIVAKAFEKRILVDKDTLYVHARDGKKQKIVVLKQLKEKDSNKTKLLINTVPEKANILIDGKEIGKSPVVVELSKGEHKITIKKENCKEIEDTIILDKNLQYEKFMLMCKAQGKVTNENQKPIENAAVEIFYSNSNRRNLLTDKNGIWQAYALPTAKVSIEYSLLPFLKGQKKFSLNSQKEINFTLEGVEWIHLAENEIVNIDAKTDGVYIVEKNSVEKLSQDKEKIWKIMPDSGDLLIKSASFDKEYIYAETSDMLYIISKDGEIVLKEPKEAVLEAVSGNDVLYILDSSNVLHAKTKDGKDIWTVKLDVEFPVHIAPLQDGVAVSGGGKIQKMKDGKVLWTVKIADEGDEIEIFPLPDAVLAINDSDIHYITNDGKELWKSQIKGCSGASKVLESSDKIYISCNKYDEKFYAFSKSGKNLWKKSSSIEEFAISKGEVVYSIMDFKIKAFESAKGKVIKEIDISPKNLAACCEHIYIVLSNEINGQNRERVVKVEV